MAGRYASERTRFTVGEYRLRVVLLEPLGGTKGLWRSRLAFAEQGRLTTELLPNIKKQDQLLEYTVLASVPFEILKAR